MRAIRYFVKPERIVKYWRYCPCCGFGLSVAYRRSGQCGAKGDKARRRKFLITLERIDNV